MSDIVPFLAAIARQATPQPFASAVKTIVTPATPSPWLPGAQGASPASVTAQPEAVSAAEIEAIQAAAREAGRQQGIAEGLLETAALRARLTGLCAAMAASSGHAIDATSELVADAATAVMAAWVEKVDRKELFAPLVRSWLAASQAPAAAHVHPMDVGAMTAAIGDAPMTVVGDVGVAAGDVVIRGATLELAHAWEPRLRELRDGIAAALDNHP